MNCPHFEKINFEKIKQVNNQQATVEDETHDPSKFSFYEIDTPSEQIYKIPEEGIEHVNSFKRKMSMYKHSLNKQEIKDDSILESSKIMLPKQMNIKKMIRSNQVQIPKSPLSRIDEEETQINKPNEFSIGEGSDDEGDIPCQNQNTSIRKYPHILVSKNSMMTHQSFGIFNGIVFLREKLQEPFLCQLKDYIIKISKNDKIKYFIELQKVNVSISNIDTNQKGILIEFKCKSKSDSVSVYFTNAFQKQVFQQVYLNCLKTVKETRKIKKFYQQQKENIRQSNNCISDNNESQFLADKSQTGEDECSELLSSLSTNSYEGDSLVFESERMFFEQVRETCNTFDILLFKNKSLMSKMQRILTNSDYDHTALLLKTASNDLLMLEATSNAGVAIYTYNSLLKIDKNKFFSRIGLRKYNGEKDFTKISRLQNFIRKAVGKKYKFDPMYLLKSEANQQKQTFFCSQLVAQALQDAGILSNQWPSFKFLPKHFASQNLNGQIIDE